MTEQITTTIELDEEMLELIAEYRTLQGQESAPPEKVLKAMMISANEIAKAVEARDGVDPEAVRRVLNAMQGGGRDRRRGR